MGGLANFPSTVPIIGAVTIHGFTIAASATCPCDATTPIPIQLVYQVGALGAFATPAACPKCRTIYAVGGMRLVDGQIVFDLQQHRAVDS